MIGYLFITSGELFLSPIGLSKVTELSPVKLVSFMMGVWFLSSSFAHYIAGIIAKLTSGDGDHGAEVAAGDAAAPAIDLAHYAQMITGSVGENASEGAVNLMNYTGVFAQIAIISFAIGLFAIVISPIIKRMMHGIK